LIDIRTHGTDIARNINHERSRTMNKKDFEDYKGPTRPKEPALDCKGLDTPHGDWFPLPAKPDTGGAKPEPGDGT